MCDSRCSSSKSVLTAPFVIAVVVLAVAGALIGPLANAWGYVKIKQALEVKKPLSSLDASKLGKFVVKERRMHAPAIIEQLGTEEYLSWTLENPDVARGKPLKHASLDVTYYSGGYNLVPHTPDVCVVGAGYQLVKARNATVEVPSLGERSELPIRICTFEKTSVFQRQQFTVVYTFYCNGEFVATRNGVRIHVNTPWNAHAFFSKVEVSFPGATPEETIAGAVELFGNVMPVLVDDHWPDFEEAERESRRSRGQ